MFNYLEKLKYNLTVKGFICNNFEVIKILDTK